MDIDRSEPPERASERAGSATDSVSQPQARGAGPKNIIVLSDGTGNAGGITNGTNVWRIRQALRLPHQEPGASETTGNVREQVVIYEDGVGTETFRPLAILGLGFALGITRDLQTLYSRLMQAYTPGDRIYLFGFSRGAFTIRVLAYILYRCGLADVRYQQDGITKRRSPEQIDYVARQAVGAYKLRHLHADDRFRKRYGISARSIREGHQNEFPTDHWPESVEQAQGRVPIHFIGVWDTVDAVGIVFDNVNQWILSFWRFITRIPGLSFLRFGLLNYHRPDRSKAGRTVATSAWSGVEQVASRLGMSDSMKSMIAGRRRLWMTREWPTWEDDDLHPYIQAAFHAVSVDDERRTFHPVLWLEFDKDRPMPPGTYESTSFDNGIQYERKCPPNENPGEQPEAGRGHWGLLKEVEQVWFSGVHANVGGGYPKDQLSLVPLNWMLRNASKYELSFNSLRTGFEEQQDPLGKMYDSRSGAAMYYRYKPRSISTISEQVGIDGTQPDRSPKISATVLERIQKSTAAYAPTGIPPADEYLVVQKPAQPGQQPDHYDENEWPEHWPEDVRNEIDLNSEEPDRYQQVQQSTRNEADIHCKRLSDLRLFCYYGLWCWTLIFIITGLITDSASLSPFDHTGHRWINQIFQTALFPGNSSILHTLQFLIAACLLLWICHWFYEWRKAKSAMPLELTEPGRGAGTGSFIATLTLPFIAGFAAFLARPLLEMTSLSVVPEAAEPIVRGIVLSPVLVFLFAAFLATLTVISSVARDRTLSWSVYGWQCSLRGPAHVRKPQVTIWERLGGTSLVDSNGKFGVALERYVLPTGGLLLLVFTATLILKPVWRDFFIRLDITDVVADEPDAAPEPCEEKPAAQEDSDLQSRDKSPDIRSNEAVFAFDPARVLATNYRLEADGLYSVLLNVDEWKDGSICTQTDGTVHHKNETLAMQLVKLMTTEPREPYLQLLGSIGVPGRNPFPIRSGYPFSAQQSGELFLWVNDVPGFHYNNTRKNKDQKNLTIRQIDHTAVTPAEARKPKRQKQPHR